MRKFWLLVSTVVFGSALMFSLVTSKAGGGQTSSPGTGSPALATCQEPEQARAAALKFLQQRNPKPRARASTIKRTQKANRDPVSATRPQNDVVIRQCAGKFQPIGRFSDELARQF